MTFDATSSAWWTIFCSWIDSGSSSTSFHGRPSLEIPTAAHSAVADFLCCGALTFAATTNFDTHIEDAAFELGERDFRSALDGVEAAKLPDRHRPLLKLHGCHKRDSSNTLWAQSQIDPNGEIQTRLARSATWLTGQLVGRDLVILGFWTDWDYLNTVLSRALQDSTPRTVVVVDPAGPQALQQKAPELWHWANRQSFPSRPPSRQTPSSTSCESCFLVVSSRAPLPAAFPISPHSSRSEKLAAQTSSTL